MFRTVNKIVFSFPAGFILALSLIFLQEGQTYYISFQMLALIFIFILILFTMRSIIINKYFLASFMAFSLAVCITGVISPMVIAQNSSNMMLTVISLLAYAFMIGCFLYLKVNRVTLILEIFKYASGTTILILVSFMILSDLTPISFLTRESLLIQNSRLIDNFTDEEAIMTELEFLYGNDLPMRIDLFYGEPSYLALVIFVCVGSYIFSSSLISNLANDYGSAQSKPYANEKYYILIVVIGIIALLYVKSLSSIIYAFVVVYYIFVKQNLRWENATWTNILTWISILSIVSIVFVLFSYEYFLYRITQADSLSLVQRFGFLLDFGVYDYLIGVKDESRLPDVGIHNGLFYVLAISGCAGICYVITLLWTVYSLSKPLKMSLFSIFLVLAIMMQNGGVFSPNKVVLFSLIFLPLTCVRSIYFRQYLNTTNIRKNEKALPFPLA